MFLGFVFLSVCISLTITFSRTMVVVFPFDSNFKRQSFVVKVTGFQTFACFITSGLFVFVFAQFESSNAQISSLCFPTSVPRQAITFTISSFLAGILQVLCPLAMTVLYVIVVKKQMSSTTASQGLQKSKAWKTILNVSSEVIKNVVFKWTNAVFFLFFAAETKALVDLGAWVVVIASGVKCAVDPLFFCLASKMLKCLTHCCKSGSGPDQH